MKKSYLLSLIIALCFTIQCWAEFTPEAGKMYALKEKTTGLYLDIQTLGIHEPGNTTNSISLNAKPCVIYFEAGDAGKWKMKNIQGKYVQQPTGLDWNVVIGETDYDWSFNEPETGYFTIARADGKFISMDNPIVQSPLYCDQESGLLFSLVEYTNLPQGQFTLKTGEDTYLGPPVPNGLVADGVYTIQGDQDGQRGYMVAGKDYPTYPVLSEITLSGYTLNSITAIENGKYWYVVTTIDGTYLYNIGLGKFLIKDAFNYINFSDTPFAWSIVQNGSYTSIYDNTEKYLSMGCGRTAANRPIQWDTNKDDGGAQHTFTPVANGLTTYATQISTANTVIPAHFEFSATALSFKALSSVDAWFFERSDKVGFYIGYNGEDDANTLSYWTIGKSNEGYAQIFRATDSSKYLGSAQDTHVGTSITTNGSNDCNAWNFNGTYNYKTQGIVKDSKYHFTSDKIWYPGTFNRIRFTLIESNGKFSNGKNRMSLDEFVLYDANGDKVALTAQKVVGNNGKTYEGMFDGVNGKYAGTPTWNDGTEDDWFEISLYGVDLGGAFSFSFVTENTTMNATAFKIETFYAPRFNGIYTINYKNGDADAAVFIAYNTEAYESSVAGYKLIAEGETYKAGDEGDKYFAITPLGAGYSISAQGKYLQSPDLSHWSHLQFTDNAGDAGVYIFEDVVNDVFKIRDPSTADNIKYVNDYSNLVFGNEMAGTEDLSTFTITPASSYPFTVTEAGMATLCLPFNVKLAAGMYAYDFTAASISASSEQNVYNCSIEIIAKPGEVLKAGTPVIMKAAEGTYNLEITTTEQDAKTSMNGSLLRGNFIKQTLTQGTDVLKFIFANRNAQVGFYRMDDGGEIGANKCWMEWEASIMPAGANTLKLRFEETTDIEMPVAPHKAPDAIYDLFGRKLNAPQKGVNIINGKKVVIL